MNISEEQKQHVRQLLVEKKKILAVKYLNENFGLPLQDAKKMADLIEQDIVQDQLVNPNTVIDDKLINMKGCAVGKIFLAVSIVFVAVALYFFLTDLQVVLNGEKTIATVVDSPHKPVFEYEVAGEVYTYESSVSSTPPSYHLGEEVDIYVDPDHPHDVLIDTFIDRWFAVTIFSSMALIFFLISIGISRVFDRVISSLNN